MTAATYHFSTRLEGTCAESGDPRDVLPAITLAAAHLLELQPPRRRLSEVSHRPLYATRLGVTVLCHTRLPGGWRCVVLGPAPVVRCLPLGAAGSVNDTDALAALAATEVDVNPLEQRIAAAVARRTGGAGLWSVDAQTYVDCWRVQVAATFPHRPLRLERALAAAAEPRRDRSGHVPITASRHTIAVATGLTESEVEDGIRRLDRAGYLSSIENSLQLPTVPGWVTLRGAISDR